MLLLFAFQVILELSPTLFALAHDPGLFARFFDEIAQMRQANANVGGIPGTVMSTILAGLVYGIVIQASYYVLALIAFLISLHGTLKLGRFATHRFRTVP